MKVNHLNLGLTELPETVAMFERYFGFTLLPFSQLPKMAFMTDDAGALVSLFRVKDADYPKIFHIGFMLDSQAQVVEMNDRLREGGFDPETPREEHGRFTFYFKCPGGVLIEVNSPVETNRASFRDAVSLNA